jgi:hypothetical protein
VTASPSLDVIVVVDAVLAHLASSTEEGWSQRETNEFIESRVVDLRERVRTGDASAIQQLRILFAPTGSLQELSMANGWAEEFLIIAARFDQLTGELERGAQKRTPFRRWPWRRRSRSLP